MYASCQHWFRVIIVFLLYCILAGFGWHNYMMHTDINLNTCDHIDLSLAGLIHCFYKEDVSVELMACFSALKSLNRYWFIRPWMSWGIAYYYITWYLTYFLAGWSLCSSMSCKNVHFHSLNPCPLWFDWQACLLSLSPAGSLISCTNDVYLTTVLLRKGGSEWCVWLTSDSIPFSNVSVNLTIGEDMDWHFVQHLKG